MTNYERIKAMSVKSMAQFIAGKMSEFPCAFCGYDDLSCDEKCEDKTVEDIVEEWLKREKDKCF